MAARYLIYPFVLGVAIFANLGISEEAKGPLPEFTFQKVVLHPDDLEYKPTEQLIHPTIIKTEGRIENPLGKYYLYYAPHKHVATSMAHSDSLDGPWAEYENNPVVDGPSAPDMRWVEEKGKFYFWGHTKNAQTELWTSEDGIHFEHQGVSVKASEIGTRNATYSRMYEYPLEKYGSKYIMVYSGFIEGREIRCVWLAHSKDAENWVQEKMPLVEPIEGEGDNLYGPSLFQWQGRNYVVYQDGTSWRGGKLKYVEVDRELNPVGNGGERYILMDPPEDGPLEGRYRGSEFYREGDTIYLYTSGAKTKRLIAYAIAKLGEEAPEEPAPKKKNKPEGKGGKKPEPVSNVSLDEVLKGLELETVYETTFDEPLRMIREDELVENGKFAREPGEEIDWVFEGPGEVFVEDGRMHIKNDPSGNCVLWNTREFPESFLAEWDFQHLHPQGLAIIFFAAHGIDGGSIYTPGLPSRGGNFGNYTRGSILSYHTSYTATDEEGVPRGSTHLKKNHGGLEGQGNKLAGGPGTIDGKMGQAHRLRLAKINNRIILEINGEVSFDCTDNDEKGRASYGSGQIGFRQMRHAIEASYGGLKVQRINQ